MNYTSVLGGGVEVSNMPVFSTGMQLQKPMYVMQEATKPASQQVWVHAVPPSNSQALRPTANPTMPQAPQTQPVPTVYPAASRSLVAAQPQAQPVAYMTQAPGSMRLVQMPGGGVQLQQVQAQQQVVMAPQQQPQQLQPLQPGNEVVYVNVKGVLQQGVVQNGSVYLLNDFAPAPAGSAMLQLQAAQGQQAPTTVAVAHRQPGMAAAPLAVSSGTQVIQLPNGQFQQQQVQVAGQRQVYVQQVLPAGARLVPVTQPLARPAQLPQQQVQMQQQQAQRPMVMVMQPNGGQPLVQSSAPMGMVMVTGSQLAGMQQAAGARPQQMQMQALMPTQQPMGHSPAAVPAAAAFMPANMQLQQTLQPMQFSSVAAVQQQQQMRAAATGPNNMSVAVAAAGAAPNSQHASAQAFRPALAAGTKILMPGTCVSASTASLGNTAAAAASAAGALQGQLAVPLSCSSIGSSVATSQPVMVPGLDGKMSSPPVPPITPGVVMVAPAPAAAGDANGAVNSTAGSSLLALLKGSDGSSHNSNAGSWGDSSVLRMVVSSQSPSHGVIGGQRSSKDGMAASRSSTPAPAGSSPPFSQPGTPAHSNSCSGVVAAAAAASANGAHGSNKGAVMRLVARSFIETGIALEQALTMIQPADRDLLGAAFAAEAAGAPLPSSKPGVAAAALGDAAAAASEAHGSMLGGFGLGRGEGSPPGLSTTDATMAVPSSSTAGKGLPVDGGLSGLSSLSFAEDVSYANHNSINMGSWGFSLFAGSATSDLNGGAASLSSLGPAEALLADVAAAPAAAQQPAGATGKDSALVGMLV